MYLHNTFNFQLDESAQIDLIKIPTSDFYKLFNTKGVKGMSYESNVICSAVFEIK